MCEENKRAIGALAWMDLSTENAGAVGEFYSEVIGWNKQGVDMGDYEDFAMSSPEDESVVTGVCHAKGENEGMPPQWLPYFTVSSLASSLAKATEMGGVVLVAPRIMEGSGTFAVLRDPAGAVFALFEWLPEQTQDSVGSWRVPDGSQHSHEHGHEHGHAHSHSHPHPHVHAHPHEHHHEHPHGHPHRHEDNELHAHGQEVHDHDHPNGDAAVPEGLEGAQVHVHHHFIHWGDGPDMMDRGPRDRVDDRWERYEERTGFRRDRDDCRDGCCDDRPHRHGRPRGRW